MFETTYYSKACKNKLADSIQCTTYYMAMACLYALNYWGEHDLA